MGGGCHTHTASGRGQLCTAGWIHLYDDPLIAVLLDPVHGDYLAEPNAHMWEVEWSGETLDDYGLKRGATKVTTLQRIELPSVTGEQRIRFGILCAWEVCDNPAWRT